jgi:hypothetical protein
MLAKDLMSDIITPLKTSDLGEVALKMMEDNKISHLPIVNNSEFIGLISEDDIFCHNEYCEPIGSHKLSSSIQYVYDYQHIFDVFSVFTSEKLTLLPVLSSKKLYLGSITMADLLNKYTQVSSLQEPGGIIILELSYNDYSLTEIAGIVESNNAKILNMYISSHKDSTKMEVTIKINKIEISPVLQTFERFNYNVLASFSENEYSDDLRLRYESLMSYLNI